MLTNTERSRALRLIPLVVAGLLLGAPAVQAQDSTAKEHEQQMKMGKDHAESQLRTCKGEPAGKAAARAKEHEQQMKKGKDHAAAQLNTNKGEPAGKVATRAKRHEEQMKKGKDHYTAQLESATPEAADSKAKK